MQDSQDAEVLHSPDITEETVCITQFLGQRPTREPDFQGENWALQTLAQQLAGDARSLLHTLATLAIDLCQAHTVGVSLLETSNEDESVFRWIAIAGTLKHWENGTMPGDFSPCSTTTKAGQPQLYTYPERYFTYLHEAEYSLAEVLLIPLFADQQALGTIWLATHNPERHFDREDQRIVSNLSGFIGAALANLKARQTAEELVATQQAANQAAHRAIDILESMTDYFIALDREWRVTYANQAAVELCDLPLAYMVGKTHWELWSWSVGQITEQRYRQAVATQTPAHFELFYEPWAKWFEVHAYPSIEGLNIFFRDISDRKQVEFVLSQSEERLRLALGAANQGLYDLNVQTGDAIVSPEYAQMLGYDPATFEETNLTWRDRLHPDDCESVSRAYGEYIAGNQSEYRVEFRLRTQTGDWKWILSLGKIVAWDADGNPLRMLGTHTDIDDRKAAEAEREQLLIREQAAREEAERANRIKDEFLAVLSHELRTPLNPILGWTKLLQTGRLDPARTQQAIATIDRNAQLQTQLIDDLLDVARILRGKLSLNAVPVDLATVIESAIDTVRLAAEAKSIRIETAIESIATVLGDPGRLQQVVWNLLTNAVKFTPNHGQVNVQLVSNGNEAQIQVSDTGRGIEPEFLPQVFERFQQADSSTTRQFGGLGLGLAIARQLIELHGGTIRAESSGEAQGATFTVRLPLMQTTTRAIASPVKNLESISLDGLRVLVVDDEADARELVQFILEQEGAIVICAASAIEALQILQTSTIELLISDIGMPDCDGYQLLEQIRALGQKLPAIALTAYAGELNQQKSRQAGFEQHLSKPLDPVALTTAIATCLKSASGNTTLE